MKLSVAVWFVLLLAVAMSAALPSRAADDAAAEALPSSPLRTADDLKSDAGRHALGLLRFSQVAPGMSVLDMSAGGGYTTQLRALAVGANGKVWAQIQKDSPSLDQRLSAHPQANIEVLQRPFEDPFPKDALRVDLITFVLSYHDIACSSVDRARMDRTIFDALKPGAHPILIGHAARAGSGTADTKSLHRTDEQTVKAELAAAGFVVEAESDLLRNPKDPREQAFFNMNMPADRFVLRFAKPE